MKHWIKVACIIAALALAPFAAVAQEQAEGPLAAHLVVERVEIEQDGDEDKEVLRPAATALPGDLLQYTGHYTNISEEPLAGLVINGPIPDNTSFAEGGLSTSHEAEFEVLVEGEAWQGLPAYKTVKREDGTEERVPAEPADYREVRWRLAGELAPEATLETVYRVRIAQ